VLRAVVLTQYWHVTDRRTDGPTERRTELQCSAYNVSIAAFALRRTIKIGSKILRPIAVPKRYSLQNMFKNKYKPTNYET